MPVQPHPHSNSASNDSVAQPIADKPKCKVCSLCRASYPLSHFGLHSLGKYGYRNECNECRKQGFRLYRQKRYGSKSKFNEEIIRSVSHQNEIVLTYALSTPTTIYGLQLDTMTEYKLVFGLGTLGMKAMSIFPMDGSTFQEYSYSPEAGERGVIQAIIDHLNLRLEFSQIELIASKNVIYYL
jgi:hypothetical protein